MTRAHDQTRPASWLLLNRDLLPRAAATRPRALDLACGRGRHALYLAGAGFEVRAVDRDAAAIAALAAAAGRRGLALSARALDLEAGGADLGTEAYELIVGFHYLHRPLFPALIRALAPGGLLIYETFTVEQAARGRPTNPEYLLRPGELRRLVAPLEILREREGVFEGRAVAGVVARRPGGARPGAPGGP